MSKLFYPKLAVSNIRKNGQVYVPYLLACIATIGMFDVMNAISLNPGLDSMAGGEALILILDFGTIIIGIFSVIILFYTNSFLMRRRKKEIGLYNVLGMEKKHIALMMGWESIFTFLFTGVIGVLFGLIFERLMFLILMRMLHFDIGVISVVSGAAIGNTFVLFAVIFLLTLLFNLLQIHLSNPIELMNAGKTGEKEPKTKLLATIIAVICLVGAYYIAITTEDPISAIPLFFVAVLLVIIGTYLLFQAGSIVYLKMLRKNKNYYYRTDHFISISSMIYRMKQNAAGLASICILSTAVLVMLSGTVSLYLGMEDIMGNRFPREFSVTTYSGEEETIDQVQDTLEKEFSKYQVSPTNELCYHSAEIYGTVKNGIYELASDSYDNMTEIAYVSLLPLSDYNQLTGNDVSLGDDECLLTLVEGKNENSSMSLFDDSYNIVGSCNDLPIIDDSYASFYDTYYMVINDSSKIIDYYNQWTTAHEGDEISSLNYYEAFDLAGEKADIEAFSEDANTAVNACGNVMVESRAESEESFYALYGGLFFLGIFLGTLFLGATVLIIYYKQISEGFDDKERYTIMQKVGLSKREIRKSIHSQIIKVFFLPIGMAVIHIAFAFKLITRLLSLLGLVNTHLFLLCTIGTVLVFAIIYGIVYGLTAKAYYRIVE